MEYGLLSYAFCIFIYIHKVIIFKFSIFVVISVIL